MSVSTMGLNKPALPKFKVGTGRMWALRLNEEELAELTASAHSSEATKTGFIKFLIHAYYQQHVLPELLQKSQKTGIPVATLLAEIADNYRVSHAKEYYDKLAEEEGQERPARKTRKGSRSKE